MSSENLAQFLAPLEKKLRYFQGAFVENTLDPEHAREIREVLSTFALLIAKVVKAKSDEERADARKRLISTEAKLTSLFELRRLSTGSLAPTQPTATPVMKGEPINH